MRGADDVVLDPQVIEQKLHRQIVVRLDSADLRRGENDNIRFFLCEKILDRTLIRQVELSAIAFKQVRETIRFESTHESASDQPTMSRDKNSFRFIQARHWRISIFFFAALRNRELCERKSHALRSRKPTSCLSAVNLCVVRTDVFCRRTGQTARILANYCRASRKDFRDAVKAARSAFADWSKQSAYLRGQILYRAAEMLEMRQGELREELSRSNGQRKRNAPDETTLAVDRLVHYAGWTDKFSQIFGTVNPVASSHFNFTTPEPTGVVVVVCPDEPPLLALVSLVAPVILAGNTAVVLASPTKPLPALTFSEIIATSDLPAGVINVIAGDRAELAPHFASHMDVNAIVDASGDEKIGKGIAARRRF